MSSDTYRRGQRLAKWTGARVGLAPMQRVVKGIEARGAALGDRRALEVFGGDGERLVKYYAPRVKSLEIWELAPRHEQTLRSKFPQATVRIGDSYQQIRRATGPFDLVVVDNFISPTEHFGLFSELLRVLSDDAVLVVLAIPEVDAITADAKPGIFTPEHLDARRAFYRTETPDRISVDSLAEHYAALARPFGLRKDWHFFVNRAVTKGLRPRRMSFGELVLRFARSPEAAVSR